MFVDENGIESGWIDPKLFSNYGRNVFIANDGRGASPVYLRVVKQEGDQIWTEDSTGAVFHYWIIVE